MKIRASAGQIERMADETERETFPGEVSAQGKTFIVLTVEQAQHVAESLEYGLDEDEIRIRIEGGAFKELTDAQVEFGVDRAMRAIRSAIQKLERAIASERHAVAG